MLTDFLGRHITYLRLSVTDRCDMRCAYCLAEDTRFNPPDALLRIDEMKRLVRVFAALGIRKLRITGGEPLGRPGGLEVLEHAARMRDDGLLREVAITTNGTHLARYADRLSAAGLGRVNVSLDSLDPAIFRAVTRTDGLSRVLDGIASARRAGLRVKINTVVQRGLNEARIPDMVGWCVAEGHDISLIELMPMGPDQGHVLDRFVPLAEVRERLVERFGLIRSDHRTGGPSRYWQVPGAATRVGFIAPTTCNFCGDCNRVRVTSDGWLYPCLGQDKRHDLRTALRSGPDNERLIARILRAMDRKPREHHFGQAMDEARIGVPVADRRGLSVTGG